MAYMAFVTLLPLLLACPKGKPKKIAPEPDTELQSSIDAAWATFVVSDIEMQCGFSGEDNQAGGFYAEVPGTCCTGTNTANQGSTTPTRDLSVKMITMSFNSTFCLDGKLRHGSVLAKYGMNPTVFTNPLQAPGSIYAHDYSFGALVTLSDYRVDGWLIETQNGEPALLRNTLSSPAYDPSKVQLTWTFSGKFIFIHPSDPSKNITWEGTLRKTLVNSTDKRVFKATLNHTNDSLINWKKGIVSYEVNAKGFTSGNIPFTIEVNSANPLIRDFSCSPDKIADVTNTGTVIFQRISEFHPFISGIMAFTTGSKYPRQVYFGNEGLADLPGQCDNSGEILIKGNTYRVDFRK